MAVAVAVERSLIELGLLGELQRAEDIVAEDKELCQTKESAMLDPLEAEGGGGGGCETYLTEVAVVMGVMHRVILGAHNRFRVTPHGIVDVGSPDTREEEQEDMGQVVHRHEEQTNHVRASLQHAIDGVKGN